MTTPRRYPVEVREWAVRMGFDRQNEYDSRVAVISSSASEAETDGGRRAGLTAAVVLGVARAS